MGSSLENLDIQIGDKYREFIIRLIKFFPKSSKKEDEKIKSMIEEKYRVLMTIVLTFFIMLGFCHLVSAYNHHIESNAKKAIINEEEMTKSPNYINGTKEEKISLLSKMLSDERSKGLVHSVNVTDDDIISYEVRGFGQRLINVRE